MTTKSLACMILMPAFFALLNPVATFADQAEDEAAIRKSAALYVAAFNEKNANAIAGLWSNDAVFTNQSTGDEVVGRAAIQSQLVAMFKEDADAKIDVTVHNVNFVSPNVAIEDGTARVMRPGAEPDVTDYTAVHIKRDGKWLIDRMSEETITVQRSNYGRLKDLEWMIGSWVDEDENAKLETTCRWTKNQNFIVRSFKVSIDEIVDLSGIQVIGWDPESQRIRSWVFDSDGGFGRAIWTQRDNTWVINASATLPDGRKSSAVKIMKVVDENTMTWQSTGRALDGEILPNIGPIKIKRNSDSE